MPKNPENSRPERVAAESPDIRSELREQLRALIPEAFAEGKLDAGKLKALLGENGDAGPERYSFSWAGKRDAIAMLQLPTRATLVPDCDKSVNFDEAQHVFIEGENLEVLKVLYRSYFGRVKMIYIDPPYNTGNDFIYPDDFADPLDHYLRITGQKNGNGDYTTSQVDRNGRIHSAWLSMMYPRLALARQFLREDGVIFVSIDDREVHNLRMLMNEVFGDECFAAQIAVVNNLKGRNDRTYVATAHEHLLMYARANFESLGLPLTSKQIGEYKEEDKEGARYQWRDLRKRGGADTRLRRPKLYFPIYADPKSGQCSLAQSAKFSQEIFPTKSDGVDGCWRWGTNKVKMNLSILRATQVESKERWNVSYRVFLEPNGKMRVSKPKSLWIGPEFSTDAATKSLKAVVPGVNNFTPKPVDLMKAIVVQSVDEDEICMDFFAGSCTFAQAVVELTKEDGVGRRFITVQFPERLAEKPVGSELVTIADIGRHRIARAIELFDSQKSMGGKPGGNGVGVRSFSLATSNFRGWKGVAEKDADAVATQIEAFADSLVPGWKPENVIWEVALREGYSLTSRIEKMPSSGKRTFWRVTDPDREQSFVICLDDALTLEAVRALKLKKDSLFVCRDAALDDTLSANLALQCRLKVL